MTHIIETVAYSFSELSEKAKDKARDALRYTGHYLEHGWWDSVYDDAARAATILGLDIMETERPRKNKAYLVPAINFSGFSSQGDGACFRGSYCFNPKAVAEIQDYCNDAELLRIATELHTLQLARRLHGFAPFKASITTSGRYSHSHSMSVDVEYDECAEDEIDAITDEVTQIMRDFADWIYNSLEAEHDYLMSDECVDQELSEENFDEDGNSI
ncbi:MAG: antitoxin of toxin-antitoxin stability system [Polaromonas sp.]|nr:antitoxin of toxin-antitoxin stability system [Polaromonas sp.]